MPPGASKTLLLRVPRPGEAGTCRKTINQPPLSWPRSFCACACGWSTAVCACYVGFFLQSPSGTPTVTWSSSARLLMTAPRLAPTSTDSPPFLAPTPHCLCTVAFTARRIQPRVVSILCYNIEKTSKLELTASCLVGHPRTAWVTRPRGAVRGRSQRPHPHPLHLHLLCPETLSWDRPQPRRPHREPPPHCLLACGTD